MFLKEYICEFRRKGGSAELDADFNPNVLSVVHEDASLILEEVC